MPAKSKLQEEIETEIRLADDKLSRLSHQINEATNTLRHLENEQLVLANYKFKLERLIVSDTKSGKKAEKP